ncbi:MAG: hypothetical protein K1X28_00300 [Parachlamydiales bacterium]|nr:hypothetical protein [Parachlamydiales bacterium]
MSYVQKIGTFINDTWFGFTGRENTVQKATKIVVGIGVAGLAIISWKVTATAGVLYSAYKGGELAYQRFFRKHTVKRDEDAIAPDVPEQAEENPLAVPVNAGHDAHNDQQEEREEGPQDHPVIADLRRQKEQFMNDPRARDPQKIGLIFDALMTDPEVLENGRDLVWFRAHMDIYKNMTVKELRKLIQRRHGIEPPSIKTKIKNLFACFSCQENPNQVAPI